MFGAVIEAGDDSMHHRSTQHQPSQSEHALILAWIRSARESQTAQYEMTIVFSGMYRSLFSKRSRRTFSMRAAPEVPPIDF